MRERRERGAWMWAEACELIKQAERLQQQFFQLAEARAQRPIWEPPADVFELERGVLVAVALPGVARERIEVRLEHGALVVIGERPLTIDPGRAVIRRLEIPYGRFERRIELPAGYYELTSFEAADGCLTIRLRRL